MEKIIPKRVLILGSTGMLGHMLFFYLRKNKKFKIYDLSFRKKLNCIYIYFSHFVLYYK